MVPLTVSPPARDGSEHRRTAVTSAVRCCPVLPGPRNGTGYGHPMLVRRSGAFVAISPLGPDRHARGGRGQCRKSFGQGSRARDAVLVTGGPSPRRHRTVWSSCIRPNIGRSRHHVRVGRPTPGHAVAANSRACPALQHGDRSGTPPPTQLAPLRRLWCPTPARQNDARRFSGDLPGRTINCRAIEKAGRNRSQRARSCSTSRSPSHLSYRCGAHPRSATRVR